MEKYAKQLEAGNLTEEERSKLVDKGLKLVNELKLIKLFN